MKSGSPIRDVAALLLMFILLAPAAAAQEGALSGVHAKGYVGFTYDRDASANTVSHGLGQEVSTDVTGAIFNPNFISWASSFSYGHNTATVAGLDAGNSSLAGSFNAMILPAGSFPLTITYQRTRVGLGQAGFDTTTNTDRFSLDWRVKYGRLPKLAFRYGNDSSSSDVPVGAFVASDSHGSGMGISASDTWKDWNWNAGWLRNNSTTGAFLFDRPATIEQNYDSVGGDLSRRYLGGRGIFAYNISRTANESVQGLLSDLNGTQFSQSASTSVRFTDKLTTFGSFQHYRFSSEGRVAEAQDPSQYTYVVNYPTNGYTTNGGVTYRLHPRITVGDTVSYSSADIGPSVSEQATRYFTNFASVNANYTWRQFVLNGSYALGYTQLLTTIDRSLSGLSHNVSASASWARPWIALSGGFGVGHAGDGPLPGSYENDKNWNFSAESSRLRIGRLRFRWTLQDRELLGFTGFINSRRSNWSLALQRRRWQIECGKNTGSGAHQVFATSATAYEPLPPLFGVLLTDDDTNSWYVNGSGTFRRGLRITGVFRRDNTHIPVNNALTTYSVYEIHVDYRIGKIVINASYGHYANMSAFGSVAVLHGNEPGSSADRFRFRIVRTFDLF